MNPTSSLDVNTEEEVLKTLDLLSAGRTCIVISHRLNALASCDFIFKLNRGFPVDVSFARQRAELESVLREELVAENTW